MKLACLTLAAAMSCFAATRIVLIGDSTVNDQGGWGPGLSASFGPVVEVVNLAQNGRSSKSFRDEGHWAKALAAKPDYVLIQFGHNDSKGKGEKRETDPATTFRENLRRYVDESRANGATPVLVTSITRRAFDSSGELRKDQLLDFAEAVRAVAREKQTPLMDLNALTREQCAKLGRTACGALGVKQADGKMDNTHLGPAGQQAIGVMAAKELARAVPTLQPYLHDLVNWHAAMSQKTTWYGSAEAVRIADNVLLFQHDNGGWHKNTDMAIPVGAPQRKKLQAEKSEGGTTIDNGATHTQMRYLARVYEATHKQAYANAFRHGLHYLFDAQYANGGWPQFYPLRHGYWDHITYNDDAMVGVLETLTAASKYEFVSTADRERAQTAAEKGIECILKTQVVVNGKPTVWCAQHDERTLEPAKARAYELPSLSGHESVGIVRFLMSIERPSHEVSRAIENAVAWMESVKVTGLREERRPEPGTTKGFNKVMVPNASAEPLWARFYEIGTNRPMFCGRDSVVKYDVAQIEPERRNGYRWYVDTPAKLLAVDYPRWKARTGR